MAEQDAAVLYDLEERDWRAKSAELGWSASRAGSARAIAKARQQRARADAVDLKRVQARGEDPRAWATERGWDATRIHAAMRFVPPPKSGPLPKSDD